MVNSSAVDDFISLLDLNDARILVDLLKLAVAGRVGENAKETLTSVLKGSSHIFEIPILLLLFIIFSMSTIVCFTRE